MEGLGEISLYVVPVESVNIPEPMYSNTPGAETSYLEINLRQPESQMSINRMEQVELRIRYLLDYAWRSSRRGGITPVPPVIPAVGDSSISDPIFCKFDRYIVPLNSTEAGIRYVIAYLRNVPR